MWGDFCLALWVVCVGALMIFICVLLTVRLRGFAAFRHTRRSVILLRVTPKNVLLPLPLAIASGLSTLEFVPIVLEQ